MRCCAARRSSPRAARSSSTPASTPAARRSTSSSCASPARKSRIWWGSVNQPIEEDRFEGLRAKVVAYLDEQDVYVVDAFAGADPAHRLALRVVTYSPWHALFAKTLFIDPTEERARGATSRRRSCCTRPPSRPIRRRTARAPGRSSSCTRLASEVLIGGTYYAGEIKKSIFTVMNYLLPLRGVMPMHCSANVGDDGRVAVFFGLSGTGKTTLSADPERHLIGDDEHGWSDDGIFNFEGGCYAKVIRLSAEAEPEIYRTTRTFGTVLENVVMDERGVLDLDDDSKTENTRAAYKLEQIANHLPTKRAGHPGLRRHADCRRLRRAAADRAADAASRRCSTSSPATRRRSQARRAASRSRRRRSRPASAPRSCRSRRRSTRSCSASGSTATARPSGSSTRAGRAARTARASGCRSRATRAMLPRRALGRARQRRVSHATTIFGFQVPESVPGCRHAAARSALDVARPGGVRRAGREARADVRRQLREVRRRGGAGDRRRGASEPVGSRLPDVTKGGR